MSGLLYHFTCGHGRRGIGVRGKLRPWPHPMLPRPVVWLTCEANPNRYDLGLQSTLITCDRMRWRYVVEPCSSIVPWLTSDVRAGASADLVADLEEGRRPELWLVSVSPVPAKLDRQWTP